MEEEKEPVECKFDTKDFKNYIEDIYFEYETDYAILFTRKKDSKILWIPKIAIRAGVSRYKNLPQNIKLNFMPHNLGWQERKKKYYLDGKIIIVP